MNGNLDFEPRGLSRDEVIVAYWDLQADFITIEVKYLDLSEQVAEFTSMLEPFLKAGLKNHPEISQEQTDSLFSRLSELKQKMKK